MTIWLSMAISGNPRFNSKSNENIYSILEIPLKYRSPFPFTERGSQNLHNLFLKRRVVWGRVVWGRDGQNIDHWINISASKKFRNMKIQHVMPGRSIFYCQMFLCSHNQVDQRKSKRHLQLLKYMSVVSTPNLSYAFRFKDCFKKYKTVCSFTSYDLYVSFSYPLRVLLS